MSDDLDPDPDPDRGRADAVEVLRSGGVTVVSVASPDDPAIVDFQGLTDVAMRSAHEPAAGLFVAEGEKTIRRALGAGYALRAVLTGERWLGSLAPTLVRAAASGPATVRVATDDVMAAVTGYAVHRGALASFERRPLPPVGALAQDARTLVILEDLTDHTNVGLVFRSAAALGVSGAVLSPRCADPLYRRAIRTSMGAVLTLPYARMTNWYADIAEIRDAGHRVLALTPDAAAEPLEEALERAGGRVALILGAEGDGVSKRWLAQADERVRIPMALGVDSLNVAAAAAIACHALGRRELTDC